MMCPDCDSTGNVTTLIWCEHCKAYYCPLGDSAHDHDADDPPLPSEELSADGPRWCP